jgi:hypothetical protein
MARTVFLLSGLAKMKPATATKPILEQGLVSYIQHVAFVITQEVRLMDVLTALSSLPHLKTVFILLPEYRSGHFQNVTTDNTRQHVASNLDAIAGCLSAAIGSHTSSPLGLFVESDNLDPKVEAFYTGINAPQLNVVVPQQHQDCQARAPSTISSTGFSLFEYA